ncbi:hypothetical protein HPB50_015834 [Hyalomma asiaticum]|uniref:Uncharacterized protein n=1 Tax=Hyalomma asiaticum TaxID=266040 RepID=A0ACB7RR95_HYAAI|nr:hypothetical protein HPB50_015834 [Hyalomma asiaticum]
MRRCSSSPHWANSGACPARSRTRARCGKRGHFAKVCQSSGGPAASIPRPSTVTNAVTVRKEDATLIHAASPSSPGGDGLQAPVQCPAVVPSHSDSLSCTVRVLKPPGSLTAPVQCPAVVPSHHELISCTEHVSEPQSSIQALSEPSTEVSSPHAVSHIIASWSVLFPSVRKFVGVPDYSCVVLELPIAPAKDAVQTSASTLSASPVTEAPQSAWRVQVFVCVDCSEVLPSL